MKEEAALGNIASSMNFQAVLPLNSVMQHTFAAAKISQPYYEASNTFLYRHIAEDMFYSLLSCSCTRDAFSRSVATQKDARKSRMHFTIPMHLFYYLALCSKMHRYVKTKLVGSLACNKYISGIP